MRIGHGYDVHRLTEGRKLIIGGVDIPYEKGLLGHSDADVLAHAIMDSILGALALGDIGKLFPDNDPDEAVEIYRSYHRNNFGERIKVFPGMKELLAVGKAAGMNAKNCKVIAEEIWEKTRTLEATYRGWKS